MTILYDPNDFNELSVLTQWRGTIMPAVLCSPSFWFLLMAHIVFLFLHIYHEEVEMPSLPWKLVGVPTALLTFFLVFYSSNCFKRYYEMFNLCMNMAGCVQAYVGMLRVHFFSSSPEELWNLGRYVIASVFTLYYQLAKGSDGGRAITEREWGRLLKTGLVSEGEVKRLQAFKGFVPWLLQVWGLRALSDKITELGKEAKTMNQFQNQVIALRNHCANLIATVEQPVPFPYYHTLTLMLSLNLLLMAYAMIEFETIMTIPCFFIIALVALGLKETAVSLSDPFGGEDVDFETEVYMAQMLANAKSMISEDAKQPGVQLGLATGREITTRDSKRALIAAKSK